MLGGKDRFWAVKLNKDQKLWLSPVPDVSYTHRGSIQSPAVLVLRLAADQISCTYLWTQ